VVGPDSTRWWRISWPISQRTAPAWPASASSPAACTSPTRLGDDDAIDCELSAVCRAIWGFTLDDFTDGDLSPMDHAWLDQFIRKCAIDWFSVSS
jgi:hypothetical protein